MEFWGVEVKSGEPLKVQPEFGKIIHISQAALGEVKDVKAAKHVPIRLTIDSNKYIIGTLSAENMPQLMFDLVFEREFELSHDLKNCSIYFMGYVADDPISDGEEFPDEFDDESEDELQHIPQNGEVKAELADVRPAKSAKAVVKKEEKLGSDDDDDDEDYEESDSDDEMSLPGEEDSSDLSGEDSDEEVEDEDDSSGEDEDDSSEEEMPPKVQSKKRPAESSAQKTPTNKKAKQATPDKTGGKKGHVATPFPSKAAAKSANKTFNSKNAQSHSKAKHSAK